jgi:3-phenylpropionate/trans-cinnamate dioxygenase ferredoxin reductase subunit
VYEVRVQLETSFDYRPGQYVKVVFTGFPAREYSPAGSSIEAGCTELTLHIRRYENGLVSAALDDEIRPGHRATIRGPFGNAFYRSGNSRLILVSSGTGWAPIVSLAHAARSLDAARELVIIASARDSDGLYMLDELASVAAEGATQAIACCGTGPSRIGVRVGWPTEFMPTVRPDDVVYVAGAPDVVDSVRSFAMAGGAECYADPFAISANHRLSDHARRWWRALRQGEPKVLRPV